MTFTELARGVDDATWTHHARGGDFSAWLRDKIGDADLAADVAAIETDASLDSTASRKRIIEAVERRYTAPV